MSNSAMKWAWNQKCGSHAAKCVLVSLADHMSDDGKCFPSFDRLIEHTELSRQGVSDQIHKLEKAGLLTVIRKNGAPNHYRLPVNAIDCLPVKHVDQSSTLTGQPQTHDQSTADSQPVNGTDQNSKNPKLTILPKAIAKPKHQPSERGLSFADWFRTLSPDIQLPESWRENWAKCYDDMIRLDKRTPEAIAKVCKWARADEFWRSNFLTPKKLRDSNKQGVKYFDVFLNKMPNFLTSLKKDEPNFEDPMDALLKQAGLK